MIATKNAIYTVRLGPGILTNLLLVFMDSNMSFKLTTATDTWPSSQVAVAGKLFKESSIFSGSSEIL